ncbi:hypothetical protein evm_012838 [Chilo suppressalis]|nr:hypothetical protein evm_012838 [Chilo suppressalis]
MASASNVNGGVSRRLITYKRKKNTMEACSDITFKEGFYRKLIEYDDQHQGSHRKAWTSKRIIEVINDIKSSRVTKSSGQRRTAMNYYWMNKYDIMTDGNEDCLILKRPKTDGSIIRILPREQYFDVLAEIHKSSGHGGRDKILYEIKNKYYIPKKAVEIFVSLCPACESKREERGGSNKVIVTKPVVTCDFNSIGQVDLLDFQSCSDGEYKWLLNYQDYATKFLNLRPLKTKGAVEVASELMKIFLTFGAPNILQSDNGREFTANIIKEIVAMWPECKIVLGNSRDSDERINEDVENMLRAWMNGNKSTNWSTGCFFVQYLKNTASQRTIGMSSYKALFGSEPKAGLIGSDIPTLNTFTEQKSAEATNSAFVDNDSAETEMENAGSFESKMTCSVCSNDVTGANKCEFCNSVVGIFEITTSDESDDSSETIKIEHNVDTEMDRADKGLKRAADKIIDTNVKKMLN